jgi:hypothetical protein
MISRLHPVPGDGRWRAASGPSLGAVRWLVRVLASVAGLAVGYVAVVTGKLAPDVKIGRRSQPLGPITREIAAPPEIVFDVIAAPYLSRTPRALSKELKVLERGSDMVLAEHYTETPFNMTAVTLETVRFERPSAVYFRLARGPVPLVTEKFELAEKKRATVFTYSGELETDFWTAGELWGRRVARAWEKAVKGSLDKIAAEAERRSGGAREGEQS